MSTKLKEQYLNGEMAFDHSETQDVFDAWEEQKHPRSHGKFTRKGNVSVGISNENNVKERKFDSLSKEGKQSAINLIGGMIDSNKYGFGGGNVKSEPTGRGYFLKYTEQGRSIYGKGADPLVVESIINECKKRGLNVSFSSHTLDGGFGTFKIESANNSPAFDESEIITQDAWEESKHPRNHGKFAKKGEGSVEESVNAETPTEELKLVKQHLERVIAGKEVFSATGKTANAEQIAKAKKELEGIDKELAKRGEGSEDGKFKSGLLSAFKNAKGVCREGVYDGARLMGYEIDGGEVKKSGETYVVSHTDADKVRKTKSLTSTVSHKKVNVGAEALNKEIEEYKSRMSLYQEMGFDTKDTEQKLRGLEMVAGVFGIAKREMPTKKTYFASKAAELSDVDLGKMVASVQNDIQKYGDTSHSRKAILSALEKEQDKRYAEKCAKMDDKELAQEFDNNKALVKRYGTDAEKNPYVRDLKAVVAEVKKREGAKSKTGKMTREAFYDSLPRGNQSEHEQGGDASYKRFVKELGDMGFNESKVMEAKAKLEKKGYELFRFTTSNGYVSIGYRKKAK